MLACAGMLQGRLFIVLGAEDYFAVVRREAAAAAAPHLRGQDPWDVCPWGLRRLFSLISVARREGEALLIVRRSPDCLHALLQEFLERAPELRQVDDGAPLEVAGQEVELPQGLLLPSLHLRRFEQVGGEQRHAEVEEEGLAVGLCKCCLDIK